jgi:transcriptional regulator with XRE-family HTH domain
LIGSLLQVYWYTRKHKMSPKDGSLEITPYNPVVPRDPSKPRPAQGAHLAALRKAVGLSQTELAKLVGERQQNIAFWEQSDKPPRSDVLPKLASVFGVRVEQLLNPATPPSRRSGPVSRMQKVFTEVGKLPRRQQDKIVELLSALVDQYKHV